MLPGVRKNLPAVAAGALIFCFAAANLLLIRQSLRPRAAPSRYQPDELQAGDRLPPFRVQGLAGEPFSASCEGGGPNRHRH